jgi:hypothetical protein
MKTLLAPLAVVVALVVSSNAFAWVTQRERAVLRYDAWNVRSDIRRAGPIVGPVERAVIRHDVRDLRYDVRRAVWR